MRMNRLSCLALVGTLLVGGCAHIDEKAAASREVIGQPVCLPPMDFAITAVKDGYVIVPPEEVARTLPGTFPSDHVWIEKPAPGQNLNDEWITIHQFGYAPDEFGEMCLRVFLQYEQQQTIEDYWPPAPATNKTEITVTIAAQSLRIFAATLLTIFGSASAARAEEYSPQADAVFDFIFDYVMENATLNRPLDEGERKAKCVELYSLATALSEEDWKLPSIFLPVPNLSAELGRPIQIPTDA
jgi:hypothetical protein